MDRSDSSHQKHNDAGQQVEDRKARRGASLPLIREGSPFESEGVGGASGLASMGEGAAPDVPAVRRDVREASEESEVLRSSVFEEGKRSRRDIKGETTRAAVGRSGAVSSAPAPRFDLIDWQLIRRLEARLRVGAMKYGDNQYVQGLDDADYVRDRINHLLDHLFKWLSGDTWDDNFAGVVWGVHFIAKVELYHPEVLDAVIRYNNMGAVEAREMYGENEQ